MNAKTSIQEASNSPGQQQNFITKGEKMIKYIALSVMLALGIQNTDEAGKFVNKVKATTQESLHTSINYSYAALHKIMDSMATDAHAGLADAQKRMEVEKAKTAEESQQANERLRRVEEERKKLDAEGKKLDAEGKKLDAEINKNEAKNVVLDKFLATQDRIKSIYVELRPFSKNDAGAKPLLQELFDCKVKLQLLCDSGVKCGATDKQTFDGIDDTMKLFNFTPKPTLKGTLISKND